MNTSDSKFGENIPFVLPLKVGEYEIAVRNDPLYRSGLADNPRSYDIKHLLGSEAYWPSSHHTITVSKADQVLRSCILIAEGGASGVHQASALLHQNSCLVAVGPFLCSLEIPSLQLRWATQVDEFTCFGVYFSAAHNCFLSHGELAITRVELTGEIAWKSNGWDIFTGNFLLLDDDVEVTDFNGERYRIIIATGDSQIMA